MLPGCPVLPRVFALVALMCFSWSSSFANNGNSLPELDLLDEFVASGFKSGKSDSALVQILKLIYQSSHETNLDSANQSLKKAEELCKSVRNYSLALVYRSALKRAAAINERRFGKFQLVEQNLNESLSIANSVLQGEPTFQPALYQRAATLEQLGMWYLFNGDSRKSKDAFQKALSDADDARQSGARGRSHSILYAKIAQHYVTFEMFDENMEALQVLDQAIRALMPFIKTQQESDGIYSVRLPLFYEKACILRKTGANEDALKCLDTAIEGYRGVLQRSHHLKQQDLDWVRMRLADTYVEKAETKIVQNKSLDAIVCLDNALDLVQQALSIDPTNQSALEQQSRIHTLLQICSQS
jgi:tetratricopeptide (TPR) repeat protein